MKTHPGTAELLRRKLFALFAPPRLPRCSTGNLERAAVAAVVNRFIGLQSPKAMDTIASLLRWPEPERAVTKLRRVK